MHNNILLLSWLKQAASDSGALGWREPIQTQREELQLEFGAHLQSEPSHAGPSLLGSNGICWPGNNKFRITQKIESRR